MKKLAILSLVLSLIVGNTVFAQGGLSETYTSSDGFLSINYPSGWTPLQDSGMTVILNRESLLSEKILPPGSAFLGILTPEFLTGIGMEPSSPPTDMVSTLSMLLASEDDMLVGDIETTTVGDHEMAKATLSSDLGEGMIGAIGFGENTVGVWSMAAAGEWSDNESLIMEMLNTMTYAAPDIGAVALFTRSMLLELDSLDEWASTYDLAFSPDEHYLAAAAYENDGSDAVGNFIQVWDFQTGEQVQKITCAEDSGFDEKTVLFTASGEVIAKTDAGLEFYDVLTGEKADTLEFSGTPLEMVGDGSELVYYTVAGDDSLTAAKMDLATGESVEIASGNLGEFGFSPDGTKMVLFVVGDSAVDMQLYDFVTGNMSDPFYEFVADRVNVSVSNDGSMVAMSVDSGEYAVVVDAATGEELFTLPSSSDGPFDQVLFTPDGRYLFITAYDKVLVIDVTQGIQVAALEAGIDEFVESLVMDTSGTHLVAAGYNGRTRVWEVSNP